MHTATKLGPAGHGRPMTLEEFSTADWEEGYQYELIDGTLYVAAQPNLAEGSVERWIFGKLWKYSEGRPDVINFVYNKARVFVSTGRGVTNPEPDVAAYRAFPALEDQQAINWQHVSPILVVEVLSADDPDKDLIRNVRLYGRVPAIKEYWVMDARRSMLQPAMRVHRRERQRWRIIDKGAGETYTSKLLPGFELTLDLRT